MTNKSLHRIFVIISTIGVMFLAVYSLIVNYKFPDEQLNFFFSLFYLIMALNIVGKISDHASTNERLRLILTDIQNIVLYCILSASFSVILIHSGISVIKTALIVFFALAFYNLTFTVFKRSITLILMWINFYLFMGLLVFSLIPGLPIDLISRYNPLAGLIVALLT